MRYIKPLLVCLLVALITTTVFGCQPQGKLKQVSAASGGVFTYFLQEPLSIDPLNSQEAEGIQVIKELFDGLVDYDPKTMKVIPALAKSWKSDPEGLSYTFNLRRGVKFHNGREVTASDFKYAWERVAAKGSGSNVVYHLAPIKGFDEMQDGKAKHLSGVKVKGKYTLVVTLSYPFSDFPVILGHPVFSPVPKEAVEKDPEAFSESPVGNGPFAMAEPWNHRENIKVKKNKNYYGRKALLDGVEFRIFADLDTAFLEFKSGSLNYTPIPLGQVKATVEEFKNNAIVGKPQLSVDLLGFDIKSKPFKGNKNLRKAVDAAIDREGISDNIFENTRVPAAALYPPELAKKPATATTSRRLAKAKRLMKRAGYPGGKGLPKIRLAYVAEGDNEQFAQAIQASLSDIGINVELYGLEYGAFMDRLFENKLKMFIFNWSADYPTPDTFVYPLFFSESENNVFGYKNKDFDKALLDARMSVDPKERQKRYLEAQSIVLSDMPAVPLLYRGSAALHSRDVRGFIRTAQDGTPLERVWLKK